MPFAADHGAVGSLNRQAALSSREGFRLRLPRFAALDYDPLVNPTFGERIGRLTFSRSWIFPFAGANAALVGYANPTN
jgi:hypothetical protein